MRKLLDQVNLQIPQEVFERLQSAIDFESSMETGATTIKDGYDAELDQIRNVFDSLESFLTQAAHQILEIVPLLQNISVEYVPQIGYLVAVPHTDALLLQPYVKVYHIVRIVIIIIMLLKCYNPLAIILIKNNKTAIHLLFLSSS